jgi:hypothetical protein
MHLKDSSKLKRALKGPVLPLMILDFAEGALLNEKLRQIQEQLSIAIAKTEQLQRAALAVPFEKLTKLQYLDTPEDRALELRNIDSEIDRALTVARERVKDEQQRAEAAAEAYGADTYIPFAERRTKRQEVFKAAEQLLNNSQIRLALLVLRARVQEELGQHRAAIAASESALEFGTASFETLNSLIGINSPVRSVDHLKGPFVKRARIRQEVNERATEMMASSANLLSGALVQFVTQASNETSRLSQRLK